MGLQRGAQCGRSHRPAGAGAAQRGGWSGCSAGEHTGRSEGRLCYGSGKLDYAEAFARSRGVSLGECVFYTDSISDLPVLERVGRPVVVNPDGRLR